MESSLPGGRISSMAWLTGSFMALQSAFYSVPATANNPRDHCDRKQTSGCQQDFVWLDSHMPPQNTGFVVGNDVSIDGSFSRAMPTEQLNAHFTIHGDSVVHKRSMCWPSSTFT